jgi:hypothetical protein
MAANSKWTCSKATRSAKSKYLNANGRKEGSSTTEMINQPQAQHEHAARHQEPSTSISTHSYFLVEHNQGEEEREAEKEVNNSERSAAHRRAEYGQERWQCDNVLADERWQATVGKRKKRERPEEEVSRQKKETGIFIKFCNFITN